jgi:hypothetical protein
MDLVRICAYNIKYFLKYFYGIVSTTLIYALIFSRSLVLGFSFSHFIHLAYYVRCNSRWPVDILSLRK